MRLQAFLWTVQRTAKFETHWRPHVVSTKSPKLCVCPEMIEMFGRKTKHSRPRFGKQGSPSKWTHLGDIPIICGHNCVAFGTPWAHPNVQWWIVDGTSEKNLPPAPGHIRALGREQATGWLNNPDHLAYGVAISLCKVQQFLQLKRGLGGFHFRLSD